MKRKFSLLLTLALVLTQMVGCGFLGGKVDAESLVVNGINKVADAKSSDLNFGMKMDMAIEESEITVDLGVEADMNLQKEGELTYTDGYMKVSMLGMSEKFEYKSWDKIEGDKAYSYRYDETSDVWLVSETDVEDDSEQLSGTEWFSLLKDAELKEVESKDDGYVVTGLMGSSDFDSLTNGMVSSLVGDMSGTDIDEDDIQFKTTLTFDRDSKDIVKMEFVAEDIEVEDGVVFNELSVTMKFKSLNEKLGLEIPKSVLEDAVSIGDIDQYLTDSGLDELGDLGDFGFASGDFGSDSGDFITNEPEETNINPVSVTSNLSFQHMKFYINGKEYELGKTTLQDLLNDDLDLDDDTMLKLEGQLKPEKSTELVCIENGEYEIAAYVEAVNFTDEPVAVKNVPIAYISFDMFDYSGNPNKMVSVGIDHNLTKDEAIAKFGEPTYEYSDEYNGKSYETIEYEVDSKSFEYETYGYRFEFTDGVLQEIIVTYMP